MDLRLWGGELGWEERVGVRTREGVADVWDGLHVLEELFVEDAGGGGEGAEVDGGHDRKRRARR